MAPNRLGLARLHAIDAVPETLTQEGGGLDRSANQAAELVGP